MRGVAMQTAEPVSTRKATDRLVKIINSTYSKEDLKQITNNTNQMYSEGRTQLLRLLKDLEDYNSQR